MASQDNQIRIEPDGLPADPNFKATRIRLNISYLPLLFLLNRFSGW
jgi:hypothetical protein